MSKIDTTKPGQPRRTTFGEVVAILPTSGVLTTEVLNILDRDWGAQPVDSIVVLTQFEMAQQLLAIMPDASGFDNDKRFQVARELYKRLHELFPDTPAANGPTHINVTLDKTPGQMSLQELLTALAADLGRYDELKSFIEQNNQLRPALRATAKYSYAWVIPDQDGTGIDVTLTMTYVNSLSHMFAVAQEIFQGRRPITLKRAVGKDQQALIHPFEGKPVLGPDRLGFDFSELYKQHPQLVEALLWARISRHPAWPTQISDHYGLSTDLFDNPSGGRWKRILDAYQAAVENDSTQRINPFWPKDLGVDQIYGFGVTIMAEAHDETYYRRQLYSMAQAHKSNNSGTLRRTRTVMVSFTNNSGDCVFNDVILLEGGSNNSGDVYGTIYMPSRYSIRNNSGDVHAVERNMSYQKLYELAKSWGL